MNIKQIFQKIAIFSLSFICAYSANATIVQFQTNLGNIEVNLYDTETPETVANFLAYIESGAYDNTVIHRSVSEFIIQGGGYTLNEVQIASIPSVLSPINEPKFSNVKGTIAMAKQGGDPNSATNQWFFNLADNSSNLDVQNGGFTAFGEVVTGFDVVEAMASVSRYNLLGAGQLFVDGADAGAFNSVPLRDYTEIEPFIADPAGFLLVVEAIVVIDASSETAADLSPTPNTLILPKKKKKSGAIGLNLLTVLMMLACGLCIRRSAKRGI